MTGNGVFQVLSFQSYKDTMYSAGFRFYAGLGFMEQTDSFETHYYKFYNKWNEVNFLCFEGLFKNIFFDCHVLILTSSRGTSMGRNEM